MCKLNKFVLSKHHGKEPLGWPGRSLEGSIEMDLRHTGSVIRRDPVLWPYGHDNWLNSVIRTVTNLLCVPTSSAPVFVPSFIPVVFVVQVMERSSVLVTQRKKTEFSTDGLAQDLNRLLLFMEGQQHNSLALPEMNFTTATSSLAALIRYLEVRCS